ncbi:MAG: hypothetical protein AMXMBFR53_30090 [Gemmatimonadota bacterium]
MSEPVLTAQDWADAEKYGVDVFRAEAGPRTWTDPKQVAALGLRGLPPYCPSCMERLEAEAPTGELGPDVLDTLDGMGVNVRRHGQLRLDELGDSPAVMAARDFVAATLSAGTWQEVEGLYLHGPTGTGKSQLAVAVVRELLEAGIPASRIVYDRGRALITQLQDRYGTGQVDEFSERRRRARVWIYEDAGTEKLTPDAFRVIEDIFDRREGCPTLVTSNYTREVMANRWNEMEGWARLRSRLAPYRSVEMSGIDRRYRRAS